MWRPHEVGALGGQEGAISRSARGSISVHRMNSRGREIKGGEKRNVENTGVEEGSGGSRHTPSRIMTRQGLKGSVSLI